MSKNVECSIHIIEADGKLSIFANIPDEAENTLAGALTRAVMNHTNGVMNDVTGQNQSIERIIPQ